MRYGENALDVIDRVKAQARASSSRACPEGVEIEIAYDRSDLIDRSIGDAPARARRGGDRRRGW